ncbi:BMP family lipoprotein [Varibaculum vaginae]|uniref:BMP family lipoprotein n=1 Tax=Varibaculum vaginae TaxID=2364797 RepID=UPI000F08B579|nr:BMP family ABC transporter substrate-binding protein [Varibaculum vaginae]
MRLRKLSIPVILLATLALTLGGCASSSKVTSGAKPTGGAKTSGVFCLVERKKSQDMRAAALTKAMKEALAKPENKKRLQAEKISVEKTSQISSQLKKKKCKNVLSVEPKFAQEMVRIAKGKTEINFAIMGAIGQVKALPNASGIDFDLRQPAFLAGYAAAGVTKSGQVGAVSDFLREDTGTNPGRALGNDPASAWASAFRLGVEYYNQFKGSGIKFFSGEQSGGGALRVKTAQLHEQLLKLADEKVDVIFVVANPSETGAVAELAAKDAAAIWTGQDLAARTPDLKANVLTSVVIDASGCTKKLLKQLQTDSIAGSDYRGTLKNTGVKLAGWGEYAPRFSDSLTAELAGIRSQIDSGKIDIAKLEAHRG